MTSPVTPFRNGMFGSRATVQEALDYCETLINTLAQTDQVGIRVGLGVLLNTIDNVVTQSQAPKPINDQADLLIQLSGMYDKLVRDVTDSVEARHIEVINSVVGERLNFSLNDIDEKIGDWMQTNLRDQMMTVLENDDISDQISNWMSNNFDLDDYNVDGAIESWMDNNIDDKVYDAVNSISFTVEIGR